MESGTLELSLLNEIPSSNSPSRVLGTYVKEKAERLFEPEGIDNFKEKVSFRYNRKIMYI